MIHLHFFGLKLSISLSNVILKDSLTEWGHIASNFHNWNQLQLCNENSFAYILDSIFSTLLGSGHLNHVDDIRELSDSL